MSARVFVCVQLYDRGEELVLHKPHERSGTNGEEIAPAFIQDRETRCRKVLTRLIVSSTVPEGGRKSVLLMRGRRVLHLV